MELCNCGSYIEEKEKYRWNYIKIDGKTIKFWGKTIKCSLCGYFLASEDNVEEVINNMEKAIEEGK